MKGEGERNGGGGGEEGEKDIPGAGTRAAIFSI